MSTCEQHSGSSVLVTLLVPVSSVIKLQPPMINIRIRQIDSFQTQVHDLNSLINSRIHFTVVLLGLLDCPADYDIASVDSVSTFQ